MNITGEKVHIRDRHIDDFAMEELWAQDEQIRALDVIAGKTFNNTVYSIDTLSGKHIGSCNLYNWTPTEAQFGIRIGDKDYRSRGFGTEVTKLVVSYCFACTTVERIWLKVLPYNGRAIRCYRKCGFEHTGRLLLNGYEFLTMEIKRGDK